MPKLVLRPSALALACWIGLGCGSASADSDQGRDEMAAETLPAPEAAPVEGVDVAPDAAGGAEHAEGREGGEHAEGREGGEHGGEAGHEGEGEESGEFVTAYEAWDRTRDGARLYLVFDPGYGNFMGQVTNTTEATLCDVRVEVHLEGGPELGPTDPQDIAAGATLAIELSAGDATFERFTAHPETTPCG